MVKLVLVLGLDSCKVSFRVSIRVRGWGCCHNYLGYPEIEAHHQHRPNDPFLPLSCPDLDGGGDGGWGASEKGRYPHLLLEYAGNYFLHHVVVVAVAVVVVVVVVVLCSEIGNIS